MPASSAKEKLLDASLSLIREQGFTATTVDDLCARAGVTKGAFFHHFESKDALGVAAVEHWSQTTGALFRAAPYHEAPDALGRVRAYLALRKVLIRGELSQFTCVAGTLVQETYASHPTIRAACADSIFGHAGTLVEDFAVALKQRGRQGMAGEVTAESLAAHTQCVLQGAFILAKARGDARVAVESIEHLQRYIELLFGEAPYAPAIAREVEAQATGQVTNVIAHEEKPMNAVTQTIVPCLWFDDQAEEAARFYIQTFGEGPRPRDVALPAVRGQPERQAARQRPDGRVRGAGPALHRAERRTALRHQPEHLVLRPHRYGRAHGPALRRAGAGRKIPDAGRHVPVE